MTLPRFRGKLQSMKQTFLFTAALAGFFTFFPQTGFAQDGSRLQQWRETREHRRDGKEAIKAAPAASLTQDTFGGRDILLHIAPNVPAMGNRAMVVVLHGGMGNAGHIQKIIGMDDPADEGGFIVAYLNGSQAARINPNFHAWNAGGGCCGQPFKQNVDDVAYITGAVKYLSAKYGVNPAKIYGMGHSNGAMMTQRLMCETDLYQAAIPISGPLNTDSDQCPMAKGKKIRAIHGDEDKNVPINGGKGTKGVTNIPYKSQASSEKVFTQSGAEYTIDVLHGTDHGLDHIVTTIEQRDGRTLGREAALFFGLAPK